MEENRVLKGFLIPFIIIAAVVITAAVIMNTSFYKQIDDTSGYGSFTPAGYTSETLGLTLTNDDGWLYLNSERLYNRMSVTEKANADKKKNDFGTEQVLGIRRPFIELTAEVNTKIKWQDGSLTEQAFMQNEITSYLNRFAENEYEVTDFYCRELVKNGEPCLCFVIEFVKNGKSCAYVFERFNSEAGGVEIYGECKNPDRLDEIVKLFEQVANAGDDNTERE